MLMKYYLMTKLQIFWSKINRVSTNIRWCIFGFNSKQVSGKFLYRKQANLGALYKWPIKGKADQSFVPAAVSQLKVSTPGVRFVALLRLSLLTSKKHTRANHQGTHIHD